LTAADFIGADQRWSAPNCHPLPVVICSGEGAWVTDVAGRRYLDFLAGYSALNFGHRHSTLVAPAAEQLNRLTLTFWAAEAVEFAIKVARLWAHWIKASRRDHGDRGGQR
jgi:acetylornithine/succinyldiaminopimelate/putrescine aminotransferase